MKVFTNDTLNMSFITWNVLEAHLMCGTGDPVFSMLASISEYILCGLIADNKSPSRGCSCIETYCVGGSSLWPNLLDLYSSILDNGSIHFSSCDAEKVVLCRYKPSVPRQILLLKDPSSLIDAFSQCAHFILFRFKLKINK